MKKKKSLVGKNCMGSSWYLKDKLDRTTLSGQRRLYKKQLQPVVLAHTCNYSFLRGTD
jgi:hypothetical protein